MERINISASMSNSSAVTKIMNELQDQFLSKLENHNLRTITWSSIDPAGFDPDLPIEEYHDAPDYAAIVFDTVGYEVHGVKEAHDFFKKITLPFTEWAIQSSLTANTGSKYRNAISHPYIKNKSKYAEHMEKIDHTIAIPKVGYTGQAPSKQLATEEAPASQTSYFGV